MPDEEIYSSYVPTTEEDEDLYNAYESYSKDDEPTTVKQKDVPIEKFEKKDATPFFKSATWNERFLAALQKPTDTEQQAYEKYLSLTQLSADFVETATTYGKMIISEIALPVQEKTLKPLGMGGVAGGKKFIARDILFKLVDDPETRGGFIYGGEEPNYELAAKAAGSELRGARAYFSAFERLKAKGLGVAYTPMIVVVDYRGYRLTAMPLLPLKKIDGKSTLVYGSDDTGRSVHNDNEKVNKLMQDAAEDLHFAAHVVCDKVIHAGGDVEGHIGNDGNIYVLDLARTFPPQSSRINKHLVRVGQPEFYRLFRGEYLQIRKAQGKPPLSPDSLTAWGRIDGKTHNANTIEASVDLVEKIIPAYARKLDEDERHQLQEPISENLHRHGINVHHIGLVRCNLNRERNKLLFLVEMVARVLKNLLRSQLRKVSEKNNDPSEYILNLGTAHFLNLVSGADKQSVEFLNEAVVEGIKRRFGEDSLSEEEQLNLAGILETGGLKPRVVKYLLLMTGIQLSAECLEDFGKNPKGFKFTVADIVGSSPRVKHTSVLDFASGQLMKMQSTKEKDKETSLRLVHLSAKSFGHVLQSEPMHLEAEFHWTMARLQELELQFDHVEADNFVLEKLVHFRKHSPEEDAKDKQQDKDKAQDKDKDKDNDNENGAQPALVDPGEYARILFDKTWENWNARIRRVPPAAAPTPNYLILGAASRLCFVKMLQSFPAYANEKQTADLKTSIRERIDKLGELEARLEQLNGEELAGPRIKDEIHGAIADLKAALSGEVFPHFMEDKPWGQDHMSLVLDRYLNFAVQEGDVFTSTLLLECGARTEATDLQKRTSILVGADGGRRHVLKPVIIRSLIEAKANLQARDMKGNTALHLAAHISDNGPKVIGELLKAGADPLVANDDGYRADQGASDACMHLLEEAISGRKKQLAKLEQRRNSSILRKQGATTTQKASESDKPQTSTLHEQHKLKKAIVGPYGFECKNCHKKFEDDGEDTNFLKSWSCKKCDFHLCDLCLDLTCADTKKVQKALPVSIRHPEHFLIKNDDVQKGVLCDLCGKDCNRDSWNCPNPECHFSLCAGCFQYTRMKGGAINTQYINYLSEMARSGAKKAEEDEEDEEEAAAGPKSPSSIARKTLDPKAKITKTITLEPANATAAAATIKGDEHGLWVEGTGANQSVLTTNSVKKGKWYFEAQYGGGPSVIVGCATLAFKGVAALGVESDSWAYDPLGQAKWHKGKHGFESPAFPLWSVVGLALDLESRPNTLRVYVDGKDLGIAFSNLRVEEGLRVGVTVAQGAKVCLVFNEADLRQDLPRGFQTLEKRRPDLTLPKSVRYRCMAADLDIKDRPYGRAVAKLLRDDVIETIKVNGAWLKTGRGWVCSTWQGKVDLVKEEAGKGDVFYFEVEVEDTGDANGLSIGLTGPSYPLDNQLGRHAGSYAYHANSGEISGIKADGSTALKDKEMGEVLRLTGIPSGELRADRMGTYTQQPELCSGHPVYHQDNGTAGCWYHGGKNQWLVGERKNIGTSTGVLFVGSKHATPADVKETWRKFAANAWEDDPRVHFERVGMCVLPKVENVLRTIIIVAGIPDGESRADRMGAYEQIVGRKRSERMVFKQQNGNSCLWYDQGKNQYIIGDAANVETTTGAIFVAAGTAKNPWEVTGTWSRFNQKWEQVPALKVTKGEEIMMAGVAAGHPISGKMGRYLSTHKTNEDRPVYQQQPGDLFIWYIKEKNQWIVGNKDNIGKSTGSMFVGSGDADRPYKVTNIWKFYDAASSSWKESPCKVTLMGDAAAAGGDEPPKALPWGPTWIAGDVVGCGYDSGHKEIFFTRNGEHLGVGFTGVDGAQLFPSVGFTSANEKCTLNFGRTPFQWTPANIKVDATMTLEQSRCGPNIQLPEKKGRVGYAAVHSASGLAVVQPVRPLGAK